MKGKIEKRHCGSELERQSEAAKECVYAIAFGDRVKIGRSISPERRLRTLQTQAGVEADRILVWGPIHLAGNIEVAAHKALSDRRLLGEYFEVTIEEAAAAVSGALNEFEDWDKLKAHSNRSEPGLSTVDYIVWEMQQFDDAFQHQRGVAPQAALERLAKVMTVALSVLIDVIAEDVETPSELQQGARVQAYSMLMEVIHATHADDGDLEARTHRIREHVIFMLELLTIHHTTGVAESEA